MTQVSVNTVNTVGKGEMITAMTIVNLAGLEQVVCRLQIYVGSAELHMGDLLVMEARQCLNSRHITFALG